MLLSGLYLMVLLFAQDFHHHKLVFESQSQSKNIQEFSKSTLTSASNSCLSCHFLLENLSEVPVVFEFKALVSEPQMKSFVAATETGNQIHFSDCFLRGPPSVFIL